MESSEAPEAATGKRQQLSKGMEHIRYAVTYEPLPRTASATPSSPPSETLPTEPSSDSPTTYGVPNTLINPPRAPPSRSHDPMNNQKRSDPFQFGSRYLEEGDNIFEFNAWDHVETDAVYQEFASQQFDFQRSNPVSDLEKPKYNTDPAKWWNKFYSNNTSNFFKDRKWLKQEFPILGEITEENTGEKILLEVGAGAGNTAFPVLQLNQNPLLKVHACDFSKKAVELIRENDAYGPANAQGRIQADVWDLASSTELPPHVTPGSVDVVMMIFTFSALAPSQWIQAVSNVWTVLKPGGQVLFRDYGRGDLAQVRFKKGRYLEENFYVRGDGTRVYFFEEEELRRIWTGQQKKGEEAEAASGDAPSPIQDDLSTAVERLNVDSTVEAPATPSFEVENLGVDRRLLVNRQRKLKMYRCWMQAVFRKPLEGA